VPINNVIKAVILPVTIDGYGGEFFQAAELKAIPACAPSLWPPSGFLSANSHLSAPPADRSRLLYPGHNVSTPAAIHTARRPSASQLGKGR
jgi:hypothetical protein